MSELCNPFQQKQNTDQESILLRRLKIARVAEIRDRFPVVKGRKKPIEGDNGLSVIISKALCWPTMIKLKMVLSPGK